MNPVIDHVCRNHSVTPEEFFGKVTASHVAAARCAVIQRLSRDGLRPYQIAQQTKLHVQTVYYWLNPSRRNVMREKSRQAFCLKSVGGKRQNKAQRQEIIEAYLEDPSKGTALACSRGLHPLYAYKLVRALGLIPRKDGK